MNERVAELEAENQRLRTENARLRAGYTNMCNFLRAIHNPQWVTTWYEAAKALITHADKVLGRQSE